MDETTSSNNSHNADTFQARHQSDLFFAVLILMTFVGVVDNVLNILVLTRPNMRSIIYRYMLTLAISDFIVLNSQIVIEIRDRFPAIAFQTYISSWFTICLNTYIQETMRSVSSFLTITITFERYIAVCYPMKYKTLQTHQTSKIICSIIFVSSWIFHLPFYFQRTVIVIMDNNVIIYQQKQNNKIVKTTYFSVFAWSREILWRISPAVLITIMNCLIIRSFRKIVQQRLKLKTFPMTDRNFQDEYQLIVMLTLVTVFCLFASIMGATYKLLDIFEAGASLRALLAILSRCFEKASFGVTFFIYYFCNGEFRTTFKLLFSFKSNKIHPLSNGQDSIVTEKTSPVRI